MKWKNIVIAGDVGTGTTTLAQNLAEKLGWRFISAGDFFRKYASENNIPLWNKALIPDEFEREVDFKLADKMKDESEWVFDTHYGGWFARELDNVYRVLLTCDRDVANKRMLERKHTHIESVEEIEKRRQGLYAKFKKLYSEENYEDPKLFHLVLDTTNTTPSQTLKQVLEEIN